MDLSLIDWEFLYHTRVEVLDPVSRRVVARRTIDGPVTGVLPDGRVAVAVITTPALLTDIAIVRLRLDGL